MVQNILFFAGILAAILGLLVLVYDYPQIAYIQGISGGELSMISPEVRDKFDRIRVEFYAGAAILGAGIAIMAASKLRKTGYAKAS